MTGYTPVRGQCCEPLKPEPGPGDELRDLLAAVGHVPGQDTLILVGDLVNKGPKSAARFALVYQTNIRTHVRSSKIADSPPPNGIWRVGAARCYWVYCLPSCKF